MDEDQEKPEPKISTTEVVFGGIVLIIADIVCLIPIVGDIEDLIIGLPLQLYLYMKKINSIVNLVAIGGKALPGSQEFPLWIADWAWIVIKDRTQGTKLAQLTNKLTSLKNSSSGSAGGALKNRPQFARDNNSGVIRVSGDGGKYYDTGITDRSPSWETNARNQWSDFQSGAGESMEEKARRMREDLTPRGAKDPMKNLQQDLEEPQENYELPQAA